MGLFSNLFGGGRTTTTNNQTSTTTPYQPVQGTLERGAGIMQNYLDNPRSSQVFTGNRVAPLSSDTQNAIRMMRGSQGANDAFNFFSGVMNGGAGGMNPAVQQMQDAIQRQVMAANNATFSRSGTVGGTAHQESLSRGLADGLAQPLFNAYENDMARRMQAGGMLPGIDQQRITNRLGAGQIRDSHNQARINANMQQFNEQRDAAIRPLQQIMPLAMGLGGQFGTQTSTGTQTTQQRAPLGQQLIGGLMAGAGLFANPALALGAGAMGGGGGGSAAPWSWNAPQGSSWFNSPFLAPAGQQQAPLPWGG